MPPKRERSSSSVGNSDEVLDLVVPRYINPVVPPGFLLSAPVVRGVNMVVTCSLNASVDPTHCARNYPGLFVDPCRFAAGTSRTANAVALFFSSGRVVCTGASSLQLARAECKRLALRWLSMGQLVSFSNFDVENVVCSACTGFYLDLNAIARACPVDAQYDAALFPGLIFRFRSPSIVCLLFLKGPCIITGSKSMAETLACWAWLYNRVLCRFRLYNVSALSSAEYHARSQLAADTSVRDMERLYREHVQTQARAACCAADEHPDSDAYASALVDTFAHASPGLSALEAMYEAALAVARPAPAEAALALSAEAEAERWRLADADRRLAQRRGPLDVRLARLFAEAVDAGGVE